MTDYDLTPYVVDRNGNELTVGVFETVDNNNVFTSLGSIILYPTYQYLLEYGYTYDNSVIRPYKLFSYMTSMNFGVVANIDAPNQLVFVFYSSENESVSISSFFRTQQEDESLRYLFLCDDRVFEKVLLIEAVYTYSSVFQRNIYYPYSQIELNTEYGRYGFDLVNAQGSNITIDDLPSAPGKSFVAGGQGSFSLISDMINNPSLPTIGGLGTGFISMYKPTLAQLNSLADCLWTNASDIFNQLSKLWNDPMQAIISLGIFPTSPTTSTSKAVKLGGYNTEVVMPSVSNQFKKVSCGSLNVKEFFGSALDYNPYTKCSIYLPFVGVQPLNIDEIMGGTISVEYNIDFLTGSFACFIRSKNGRLDSVLYHYSGNMMTTIPVTSNDFSGLYQAIVSTAGGLVTATTGNPLGGTMSVANAVLGKKESIGRSSQINGSSGLLDGQRPYLIIERPIQSLANNYEAFEGYPSNITRVLSTLSGYTSIESLKSNTLTCPQVEQDEIIALLKGGVFL